MATFKVRFGFYVDAEAIVNVPDDIAHKSYQDNDMANVDDYIYQHLFDKYSKQAKDELQSIADLDLSIKRVAIVDTEY